MGTEAGTCTEVAGYKIGGLAMWGWKKVTAAPEEVDINLVRAVRYILHRLEDKLGTEARLRTAVWWFPDDEETTVRIDCELLRAKELSLSILDPILFEGWLMQKTTDWLEN